MSYSNAWTPEQDAFLLSHAAWSDDDLVFALSNRGPARNRAGVAFRRKELGAGTASLAPTPRAAPIKRERRRDDAEPSARATFEARDRRFVRKLLEAQLAAVRAMKADEPARRRG